DELLLAVAEGGPVEFHLHLPLRRPGLHLLLEDVVARGDEALEEPHAKLGRTLRPRHAFECLESCGGTAGDDGGLAEKFAPRDEARVESVCQFLQPALHLVLLWMSMASGRAGPGGSRRLPAAMLSDRRRQAQPLS